MTDNITALESKINQFEASIREMKEATSEAHSVLKQLRQERKEVERLMSTEKKTLIHNRVDVMVKTELDKIVPELNEQTDKIYAKVGQQTDKLIALCLGNELSGMVLKGFKASIG